MDMTRHSEGRRIQLDTAQCREESGYDCVLESLRAPTAIWRRHDCEAKERKFQLHDQFATAMLPAHSARAGLWKAILQAPPP